MKAILQGEFHISASDRESLLTHLDNDAEALFIEQRVDSVSPEKWSLGYLSFLLGALVLYWLQAILDTGPDIKEEANVPVYDEIDTPLPELYSRFPESWTIGSGVLAGLFFLYGIFIPRLTVPFISTPPTVSLIYTFIGKPVITVGAPLFFSFLLIYLEERQLGSRDEDMAEAITKISKDKGYQTVVVSCGDAHLERLPAILEEKGWEVEVNESGHNRAAGVWRW